MSFWMRNRAVLSKPELSILQPCSAVGVLASSTPV